MTFTLAFKRIISLPPDNPSDNPSLPPDNPELPPVIPDGQFAYIPFTIDLTDYDQWTNGKVTIEYDNYQSFIQMLDSDFSLYYRIIPVTNRLEDHELTLSKTELDNIKTDSDSQLFSYSYNQETGEESLIANTIEVDINDTVGGCYIQIFAGENFDLSNYDTPFGHISINSTAGRDLALMGNLASLFSVITDSDDLTKANDNLSLAGLFAENLAINYTYQLQLMSDFIPGYAQLFKNCTGLITTPMLNAQPQSVDYYRQMFYGCYSLQQVNVDFDSCFIPGEDWDNQQFKNWLYGVQTGRINIYSEQLYTQLQNNETARNMMIPDGWTYVRANM